ncbi:GbsR/MarR family transcriptional regulator [Salibacterium halotolerans]|uniref:HTH-type transcriptional regulator n=1 Tax=Salibacterium halotolerans TaxID=1884432 RepID=A0A1I5LKZ8_9BACI|nr:GbsR/MarR family transcriptional regulator [Salibacterium halotolerans]SFO97516.1 DNA-binding transcriptional regulator GbsR, MarR family [Salibacterium halotolerans]
MAEHENGQSAGWYELQDIRHRFISVMAQNMGLYNITETNGRLYGSVFFSDYPMTLDEMSRELEMSKTSMSTGVRQLTDASMLTRVWEKGVRKDLYVAEADWYQSFTCVFVNRWREAADNNHKAALDAKDQLEHLKQKTGDNRLQKQISRDLEKLDYALRYYRWLDNVITLFENGDIFDIVPKK